MKKYFLILIITFSVTIIAKVQHGAEHDFMLVACPISGSTFLMNSIKKANPTLKYTNEFFTEIFRKKANSKEKKIYLKETGTTVPYISFETFYTEKWKPQSCNFSKEVFLCRLIPFLKKSFTLFALYRHRKYTFPSPFKEDFFFFMYEGFLQELEKNPLLEKVKNFVITNKKINKICAGHIIFNYILLKNCIVYNIPIIDYELLMNLNKINLKDYLETRIPQPLYNDELIKCIDECRKSNDFLKQKELAYQKLEVEPFCQELIAFIKELDPDMPYWYLLE